MENRNSNVTNVTNCCNCNRRHHDLWHLWYKKIIKLIKTEATEIFNQLFIEHDSSGYVAQLKNSTTAIGVGNNLPFNTIVVPNENISYSNGIFTILKKGNYYVSCVIAGGTIPSPITDGNIAIKVNGTNYINYNMPTISNNGYFPEITIPFYLKVDSEPTTIEIVNESKDTITLFTFINQAIINIIKF